MSIAPNLFFSNMNAKGGPAKPCRFEIILPIPQYIGNFIENGLLEKILNFPNSIYNDVSNAINKLLDFNDSVIGGFNPSMSRYLSLLCESTDLPGKSLYTADVKIYGPSFQVPYKTVYEPISFTFLCTNEFEERKLFDRWIEAIMPNDTNNFRFPRGSTSSYMTDIKIIQYDDFIKQIYVMELKDAFPIRISSQNLNWNDGGIHRLTVNFSYHKYKTIYKGNFDIGSAASSLLGTSVLNIMPKLNTII